jgi:cytochrome c-type biogenesis protein CcmE
MSGWLPKSRTARRRLLVLSAVAPVLALAVGLTLWGLSDSISYFYTPAQAAESRPAPGQTIQLGGLVEGGSIVKHADGRLEFVVMDQITAAPVVYRGDPPDLFREGQGVVATGAFREDGVFEARRLLAKHDETYMPRDLQNALKEQGEWRGDGAERSPDAVASGAAPYGGGAGL